MKFFHNEIYKQRQYVLNNTHFTNSEQYLKRLINMLHRVNIFLISLTISALSDMLFIRFWRKGFLLMFLVIQSSFTTYHFPNTLSWQYIFKAFLPVGSLNYWLRWLYRKCMPFEYMPKETNLSFWWLRWNSWSVHKGQYVNGNVDKSSTQAVCHITLYINKWLALYFVGRRKQQKVQCCLEAYIHSFCYC